jgi:hypothetical protein
VRRTLPLIFAVAAFAMAAILWIVTDRRASQRVYDLYSTSNTAPDGLSLAYGYLGKTRKVGQLTRPFGRDPIERNAVVFRVAPEFETFFDPQDLAPDQIGPPAPRLRALLNPREDAFVRAGGRFVIAAESGALRALVVEERTAHKVFPAWPAVQDIRIKSDTVYAFAELRPRMLALFTIGKHVLLARERIGAGELYVLSAPKLLRNDQLVDHLALLAALAGEKRPVYFDEVLHGIVSGDGAIALAKDWNLELFLFLAGVAALLIFWRNGRRIGPAEDDHRETRSDAIDLVRSLGALYQEVTTDSEALVLYHDALTRTVAHSTGLRGDALHKRVAELTGGLVPPRNEGKMPRAVFQKHLDTLNDAFRRIA